MLFRKVSAFVCRSEHARGSNMVASRANAACVAIRAAPGPGVSKAMVAPLPNDPPQHDPWAVDDE
eukprot:9781088-Lingulodinium_polyedra.AAC.1